MIVDLGHKLEEAAAHGLRTVDSDRTVGAVVVDAVDALFVLVLDMSHSSDHIVHLAVQAGKLLEEHCQCNSHSLIVVHLMNSRSYCSVSSMD